MAMNSHYEPSYQVDELRFTQFNGSFADKPHPVFVAYDADIDQLLVWLVEPGPNTLASEYYLTENKTFLVRDDDQEVIGFVIDEFQASFLPNVPTLEKLWQKDKLAQLFDSYKRIEYRPDEKKQKDGQQAVQRIVNYSAFQTKSARELVTA